MIARLLAGTAAVLMTGSLASETQARTLDPSDPVDALEISKRFQCGEKDGETATWHFTGNVYSRVPGEPDRLLFKGEGFNIRRCVAVEDPVRGKGWRIISREAVIHLDPKTGEVVNQWENPWTGETVDIMHIHNDPVNSRPSFPVNSDGSPFSIPSLRVEDGYVFMPFEVPLFYTNPLAGDYQDDVGNKYHAMEIFNFMGTEQDVLDASKPTAYPIIAWTRISQWAPWMKMGGRPGLMVFNFTGRKLPGGFDELPEVLKTEIRANFPIYEDAPPADDTRSNETTWTKFKLLTDRARAAAGEKAPQHEH